MIDENTQEKIRRRKELVECLKNLIIEKLNLELSPDQIEEDASLFGTGLGLDSIDALEIAVAVEEKYGVSINDDQMEVFRSINTLADHIQANRDDL